MHRASQVKPQQCRLPSYGLLDVGGGASGGLAGALKIGIKKAKQPKKADRKTGQSICYKSGQFYLLSTQTNVNAALRQSAGVKGL
jgi:hypothetical protein